jgi:hypothetical protein
MRLVLVHAGHYAYSFAIAGILGLFGYDWLRRRRERP